MVAEIFFNRECNAKRRTSPWDLAAKEARLNGLVASTAASGRRKRRDATDKSAADK
jgi:hypothetical protein